MHQDFWMAVMNHKNQESMDIMRKMREKVGNYVDSLWDKITHVDVQVDHVDVAVEDMADQASAIENSSMMRNSKKDSTDLAEKVRLHL
jgi:hypothetical protein